MCQNFEDCGTFENMGCGALFYYKDIVENDEDLESDGKGSSTLNTRLFSASPTDRIKMGFDQGRPRADVSEKSSLKSLSSLSSTE